MKTPGISMWPDDENLLLELIIVDKESRGSWSDVNEIDVRQACEYYSLPFDHVMDVIENKPKDVHTLLIHVPDFIAYLERGGN